MRADLPIYVVDDDPDVRSVIARLVATDGRAVTTFPSALELMHQIDLLPFGCLLLDISMPGRNGLDVLDEVMRRDPPWPVVMISGTADVEHAVVAFRRGAIHLLRKPFRRTELYSILKEASEVGIARLEEHERTTRACRVLLTKREREVLGAMARGEQSKITAWSLGLSSRTVDMHRGNILIKLSARNATQAVAVARELQLI